MKNMKKRIFGFFIAILLSFILPFNAIAWSLQNGNKYDSDMLASSSPMSGSSRKPTELDQIKAESKELADLLREMQEAIGTGETIITLKEKASEFAKKVYRGEIDVTGAVEDPADDILAFRIYKHIIRISRFYNGVIPVRWRTLMSLIYSPVVGYVSQLIAGYEKQGCIDLAAKYISDFEYEDKEVEAFILSDGSALLGYGNLGSGPMKAVCDGKRTLLRWFGMVKANYALVDNFSLWNSYNHINRRINRLAKVLRTNTLAPEESIKRSIKKLQQERDLIGNQIVNNIKMKAREIQKRYPGRKIPIMLEDIAAPLCFRIEKELNEEGIFAFHDDQHGTAIAVGTGLVNHYNDKLNLEGSMCLQNCTEGQRNQQLKDEKVVMIGAGAAGRALAIMLHKLGFRNITIFDEYGPIYPDRAYMDESLIELCNILYPDYVTNDELKRDMPKLQELYDKNELSAYEKVFKNADVFVGVSKPKLFWPDGGDDQTIKILRRMKEGAAVFSLANPDPEFKPKSMMSPLLSHIKTKCIGAFGTSIQTLNNSSAFPGIFRAIVDLIVEGNKISRDVEVLDVCLAAVWALVKATTDDDIRNERVLPPPFLPGETVGYNTRLTAEIAWSVYEKYRGQGEAQKKYKSVLATTQDLLQNQNSMYADLPRDIEEFFTALLFKYEMQFEYNELLVVSDLKGRFNRFTTIDYFKSLGYKPMYLGGFIDDSSNENLEVLERIFNDNGEIDKDNAVAVLDQALILFVCAMLIEDDEVARKIFDKLLGLKGAEKLLKEAAGDISFGNVRSSERLKILAENIRKRGRLIYDDNNNGSLFTNFIPPVTQEGDLDDSYTNGSQTLFKYYRLLQELFSGEDSESADGSLQAFYKRYNADKYIGGPTGYSWHEVLAGRGDFAFIDNKLMKDQLEGKKRLVIASDLSAPRNNDICCRHPVLSDRVVILNTGGPDKEMIFDNHGIAIRSGFGDKAKVQLIEAAAPHIISNDEITITGNEQITIVRIDDLEDSGNWEKVQAFGDIDHDENFPANNVLKEMKYKFILALNEKGVVVGGLSYRMGATRAHLHRIFLVEEYRERKISEKMFNMFLRKIRGKDDDEDKRLVFTVDHVSVNPHILNIFRLVHSGDNHKTFSSTRILGPEIFERAL